MSEIKINVDESIAIPVNKLQLLDDTDFKTIEDAVTFDQAGLALFWNFTTINGVYTKTQVVPTDSGGDYDWVNKSNGMYQIEIPASGGSGINNDTEGSGYFSGEATGILPWISHTYCFRPALLNNSLVVGSDNLQTNVVRIEGVDPTDQIRDSIVDDATRFSGADIAPILADTNELQTDWANGGRLDLLLDRIIGLNQENYFLDNTTYSSGQLTAGRIRTYSDAGSVGTGSNVIATYDIVAVYSSGQLTSYKVTKQ